MDKRQKLSCVVAKLQHVAEFLRPYLPLSNIHNTNFIVGHHWDTMIPRDIGLELLLLDDYQLSLLPSGDLYCNELHSELTNVTDCDKNETCDRMSSAKTNTSHIVTSSSLSCENNFSNIIACRSCELTDTTDEKPDASDSKTGVNNIPVSYTHLTLPTNREV